MLLTRNQNNEGLLRTIDTIYRNEVKVVPKVHKNIRNSIIKIIVFIVSLMIIYYGHSLMPESNVKYIVLITTTVICVITFFWLLSSVSIFCFCYSRY